MLEELQFQYNREIAIEAEVRTVDGEQGSAANAPPEGGGGPLDPIPRHRGRIGGGLLHHGPNGNGQRAPRALGGHPSSLKPMTVDPDSPARTLRLASDGPERTRAIAYALAEAMVDGELEYRRGNFEEAFAHLRRAVELEDNLLYDEPWGWMQPTRHALGALLLEQERFDEAEAVYRADLGLDSTLSRASQHPNNLWALHGLHECLERRGETVERVIIRQQLDMALARSEVEVKASCACHQAAMA